MQLELFNSDSRLKFIDLFAGIGGFHLAMKNVGFECVFACEIDKYARKTYLDNFISTSADLFESNLFREDIRDVNIIDIPEFDVLCAGFPFQPFSQVGLKQGFNDNLNGNRGNLFFEISNILKEKNHKLSFLRMLDTLLIMIMERPLTL